MKSKKNFSNALVEALIKPILPQPAIQRPTPKIVKVQAGKDKEKYKQFIQKTEKEITALLSIIQQEKDKLEEHVKNLRNRFLKIVILTILTTTVLLISPYFFDRIYLFSVISSILLFIYFTIYSYVVSNDYKNIWEIKDNLEKDKRGTIFFLQNLKNKMEMVQISPDQEFNLISSIMNVIEDKKYLLQDMSALPSPEELALYQEIDRYRVGASPTAQDELEEFDERLEEAAPKKLRRV